MKLEEIPRIKSAFLPTPLEYLPRLSKKFGNCRIWMKRDDLTGHCFGGNKERKLEYILADAVSKNADAAVTVGAIQSNHCRMTAAMALRLGMKPVLILIEEENGKTPDIPEANHFLDVFMGSTIHLVKKNAVQEKIDSVMAQLRTEGKNPYFIEGGGHNALGAMGYANAFFEIAGQLGEIGEKADHIIVAAGTGTTYAGLFAGAMLDGFKGELHGISVARNKERCSTEIKDILQKMTPILDLPLFPDAFPVYDEYVGDGYGILYNECIESMNLLAQEEGTMLDPVYNAKTFYGMTDLIRKGRVRGNIVYINTGGLPGIFSADLIKKMIEWTKR